MFVTGTPNRRTVQHYTHIHPLTEANGIGEFTCGGCKTYGSGESFRCGACSYDLHGYCATCPPTLRTFMHPTHELRLLSRGPELTCRPSRCTCDVCDEAVEGLYYRCDLCDFDVHPLCTRLPQHVRHVLHPAHPLELSRWGATTCAACHGTCRSWRYRCGSCGFDVHMDCVSTGTRQRGLGPQPYGPYPYYNNHHNGYHNHYPNGHNCGPMNPGHQAGSGPGKGRRMFSILWALTIGVTCNIVATPVTDCLTDAFNGCF